MRNALDFSSWQSLLTTALGLLAATLLMVGIRLVFMQTIQRRRERENRQINERLKTLIAAYKTLGSSFTGELSVDPSHLKQLKENLPNASDDASEALLNIAERRRRIRDAVEAALSDVILLGTEDQVALAAKAAQDMVEGRTVHTSELVVSLRNFIRQALDLQPIADGIAIPAQGPLRIAAAGGGAGGKRGAANNAGNAAGGGGKGGAGGGGGMGMGGGMALGAGASAGVQAAHSANPGDGAELLANEPLPSSIR